MSKRLLSRLVELLTTLTDLLLSPNEAESLPRAYILKYSDKLQASMLMVAVTLVLLPLLGYQSIRSIVLTWLTVLFLYIIILRLTPRLRHHPKRTFTHSFIAATALLILNILLWTAGYGEAGEDPFSLWVLYLVPLFLVSRRGITRNWTMMVVIVLVYFLAFRFFAIWRAQSSPPRSAVETLYLLGQLPMRIAYTRAACLVAISIVFHTIVREVHNYKSHVRIERETVDLLTAQPNVSAAYQAAAEALGRLTAPGIRYAFVLLWDEPSQRLKMVGGMGMPKERWQAIELAANQGITGQVVHTGKTIRVDNVRRPEWADVFYDPGELDGVQSEMAAPFKVGSKVVGVLDVESVEEGAFNAFHEATLEAQAEALAHSFRHFEVVDRQIAAAQKLFDQVIELGQKYGNRPAVGGHVFYRSWFRDLAEAATPYFGAELAAFIRLGVGTGFPLFPPVVYPRRALSSLRQAFRNCEGVPADSLIWRLLDEWRIQDWCTHEEWLQWDTPTDGWLGREFRDAGVSTLIFVPIGRPESPLAMLFLGYRRPQLLTDVSKLLFTNFAGVIETSWHSLSPSPSELHRAGIRIHQNVTPLAQHALASLDKVRMAVGRLAQSEQVNDLQDMLYAVADDVRKLREQTKQATLQERYDLSRITVENALIGTASGFVELRPDKMAITVSVAEAVEDQELFIRQLLYWIAVEGITNAVEHGQATVIDVRITTAPGLIKLVVNDNGAGLPTQPDMNQPHGIYHLRRLVRQVVGAELTVANKLLHGVLVTLSLPVRTR